MNSLKDIEINFPFELSAINPRLCLVICDDDLELNVELSERIATARKFILDSKLPTYFKEPFNVQRLAELMVIKKLDFWQLADELIHRQPIHDAACSLLSEFGLNYLLKPLPKPIIFMAIHPRHFDELPFSTDLLSIEQWLVYLQENAFNDLLKQGFEIKLAVSEEYQRDGITEYEFSATVAVHAFMYGMTVNERNDYVEKAYFELSSIISEVYRTDFCIPYKVRVTDSHRAGFKEAIAVARSSKTSSLDVEIAL